MQFESARGQVRAIATMFLAFVLTFAVSVPLAPAWAGQGGELEAASGVQLQSASSSSSKLTSSQLNAFKKASADFSIDLFGRCVADKGKNSNVTIAPMSVMNALAITANGAGGSTLKQMRDVLGDGASMASINEGLSWYNSKLVNVEKAKLKSANAIWYHKDGTLKMKKKFLSTARTTYNAKVTGADFKLQKTVDSINSWVAKQTNNMIKKVIDNLGADDRIVIVNALSFDAEWLSPYEKTAVSKAPFTNAKGVKSKVDMMYGTEHTYIEGDGVTGFVKPYAEGYRYVALLPDEGVSLKTFVKSLTGDKFSTLVAGATTATVHTALPKYTITYSNDDMTNQLGAMGLAGAFSPDANFTKMATDTTGNLYVGSVAHKTKIIVDEKGTKAAAATTIVDRAGAAPENDVKTVYLNRPFVYAIVDDTTNLPVFIGTVNNIR